MATKEQMEKVKDIVVKLRYLECMDNINYYDRCNNCPKEGFDYEGKVVAYLTELSNEKLTSKETKELVKVRNKLIYDITTRLESFSLNTVISGFMEYNNKLIDMAKKGGVDKKTLETFVILMAPFAPHISEELWSQLGHEDSVFHETWPTYDENAMKDDEKELAVQINGKTKCVVTLPADVSKEDAIAAGKAALGDKLTGNVIKEIYVPGRIINIVAK